MFDILNVLVDVVDTSINQHGRRRGSDGINGAIFSQFRSGGICSEDLVPDQDR